MRVIESRVRRMIAAILPLLLVGALSGCASNNPRDPLEPLNRGIYAFNDAIDNVVMKPIATGYRAVLPQFVRTGVSNFFSNLDDITVVINSVLQLKIPQALSDTGRFVINSTVGLLGFIDVATHLGLEKHNEDFGQTLGYWGVGNGPYLVLPFLGPSSFRDGVGRWVDLYSDVVVQLDHVRTRNQGIFTRAVSNRAQLLDSEKVLDAAAIDRYAFLRDAYLQRRRALVYDGNPPPEPEDEELLDKPNTPKSEAPGLPAAMLVDQFGHRVAGPEDAATPAQTPSASEDSPLQAKSPAAAQAAPAQANPPTAASDQPIIPASRPEPVPAATERPSATFPTTPPTVPSQPAATLIDDGARIRIVRIWLPGSVSP